MRRHLVRLGLVISVTAIASSSHAQEFGPKLQPAHYLSRSGEFDLYVDPSNSRGVGPAQYELRRNGELVWSKEQPFSLHEAASSNRGVGVGYAYTEGLYDPVGDGDFLVVVLSPQGEVVLEDIHPREDSLGLHGNAWPIAKGVFVHDELERAIVRVHDFDPDHKGDHDYWWSHELGDGALLSQGAVVRPDAGLPAHEGVRWAAQACALPGTPLTLVYWFVASWSRSEHGRQTGALFTLLDASYMPVWELDLRADLARVSRRDGSRQPRQTGRRTHPGHPRLRLRGGWLDPLRAQRGRKGARHARATRRGGSSHPRGRSPTPGRGWLGSCLGRSRPAGLALRSFGSRR